MSGLDPAEREALRTAVVDRRRHTRARLAGLERDVAALVDATADAPDDEHDPEGATIGFERQQAAHLLADARAQLDALDAVAARLDDPDLGTCAVCGGAIGLERLLARPTTRTCVRCAT